VVADALQDVAGHFGIEKSHRQTHQFDKEIGNQGDVDARAQVQQYPATNKFDGCAAEGQYQLSNQYQVDETNVLVVDPDIDNGLSEERNNQLQQTAEQQSQKQLENQIFVRFQISKEKRKSFAVDFLIFQSIKVGRGFQQQNDSFVFAVFFGAEPTVAKFLFGVFEFSGGGVGDKKGLPFAVYFIEYDEMVLIPVDNAGQWGFFQLIEREPRTDGSETYILGGFGDTEHGNAFTGNMRFFSETFERIDAPVMGGDHAEAGGAAVHGVVLEEGRESTHQ
jgi:hypothetical protein